MSNDENITRRYQNLLKVLTSQQRTLANAGASKELLETYRAVLRHLAQASVEEVRSILRTPSKKITKRIANDDLLSFDAASISLDEVDKILSDEKVVRKKLEKIAVERFHVPHGSVSSFTNISMLKQKIATLIHNERTHQTISALARKEKP